MTEQRILALMSGSGASCHSVGRQNLDTGVTMADLEVRGFGDATRGLDRVHHTTARPLAAL